jgi:hypothetical protein
MQTSKLRLAVIAVILCVFCGTLGAVAEAAYQNHMVNARNYLNSAYSELNVATANKGGYRVSAMNLIQQAIREVNLGIQHANNNQ